MMNEWKPIGKAHFQNTQVRTMTTVQLKWERLCQSSRALRWMSVYHNPYLEDKLPPTPWTNQQLVHFVATLMHEGKAETLRAALLTLLYDDLVELIKQHKGK